MFGGTPAGLRGLIIAVISRRCWCCCGNSLSCTVNYLSLSKFDYLLAIHCFKRCNLINIRRKPDQWRVKRILLKFEFGFVNQKFNISYVFDVCCDLLASRGAHNPNIPNIFAVTRTTPNHRPNQTDPESNSVPEPSPKAVPPAVNPCLPSATPPIRPTQHPANPHLHDNTRQGYGQLYGHGMSLRQPVADSGQEVCEG